MNFKSRLRQVLAVGSIESLGVIAGGLAGLLIVNVLPKDQYAQYTFLVSCMTLMLGIADMGLAHCCLPVVGQRAGEIRWVVGACQQVFRKRWWLLFGGAVFVTPYWLTTAQQHGWVSAGYLAATGFIVGTLLLALREHYASTVLMIAGHISTLNRISFFALSTRITLVVGVLMLLPASAFSVAGVLAAGAASSVLSVFLYNRAFKIRGIPPVKLQRDDAKAVDAQIYRIAKPLALPALFYQFQGVITVFIVSLFGTSTTLADIGALGRISMVLVVFDRVAAVLLFPQIARAAEGDRLVSMVVKAHLCYIGMMSVVFLTSLVWPNYWMLLIGKQYADQQSLLWMAFLSTLLMNCAGFAFRTLAARGHTVRQTLIIPSVLVVQLLCLWLVGVSGLREVLLFSLATCMVNFLYQYAMLFSWFAGRKSRQPL